MDMQQKKNQELFIKYHHKLEIHFTIYSILMLILVGVEYLAFQYIINLKAFPSNNIICDGGLILGALFILCLLILIWLSIWSKFTPRSTYAKYKINHPDIKRADAEILRATKILK